MRRSMLAFNPLPVLLLAGCATHADRVRDVRSAYYSGDTATARARLEAVEQKNPREADVLKLERASVLLSEGKPKDAEALLREVRGKFDHLEQKDLGEAALAMVTDDQRLA